MSATREAGTVTSGSALGVTMQESSQNSENMFRRNWVASNYSIKVKNNAQVRNSALNEW